MASQVSPGVVIRESDLSNAVVVGAQAIRAAFASSFRTGPVGKITNINSERELIDTFGTPAEENAADWLVASEFLRYGGQLAVVRADTGVKNATLTGTGVLIADKDSFDSGVTSEKFAARYAGSDGNNLRVVIVDHGADQVLTFDKEPDQTPVIGSTITFQSGKTVEVYDYNSITRKVTVVGQSIAVGDTVAEEDPIATFTHDGVTEAGRTPGTYTPAAHAGGASFQVVVADAGAGVGGAVTVTLLTAGDGYEIGDTITLAGAATGGGSDITITVATIVDPNTAVSAAVAWDYNSQIIGTTGLTYRAIGPRPGTSAWATERYLSYDEVHILVVDETTNTIVERFTYLSKLTDAKSPEGNSTYWKSYVNEYSRYIYAGIDLSSAEVTATGENPGGTAASYNGTAAVPKTLARILYTAGGYPPAV